jgi:hypothetical protein
MCKPTENILFCTCGEVKQLNPKSEFPKRRFKLDFYENEYLELITIWYLESFEGEQENEFGAVGMMYFPSTELENGITGEYIVNQLNSNKNLFDFEYAPKAGDKLNLRTQYLYLNFNNRSRPHIGDYLSFRFENEHWRTDKDIYLTEIFKELASGIINKDCG